MKASRSGAGSSPRFPMAIALIGLLIAAVLSPCPVSAATAKAKQRTFASPEAAVQALMDTLRKEDKTGLSAIFGPGSETVVSSGDEVMDRAARDRFLKEYAEKNSLDRAGEDKVILQVGVDDWPFPIPIVRMGTTWRFDAAAGKVEILNRRIGANELKVIDVLHAYVAAQREYVSRDRQGAGVYAYAQRIASTPGKKDGLYWEAARGEEPSPLGPLAAEAAREGYAKADRTRSAVPFHGYYFHILKAQGRHAPGGRYSYVVKGNMILGFAMVAYPARYGSSGIMTFVVNQDGVVYQKDFGKDTAKVAGQIKTYDPDASWKRAEPAAK
ncbi:MAG: DUF2950 domain-containing protein [Verrucomicrobiota bacterium]